MDSATPSRYVKLPAREAYNPDLSDALFKTLAQLRGLAYRFGGKHTPPLTVEDLIAVRRRSRATIFKHLAELRERGIIRTEPVNDDEHVFVIYLLRRKRRDRQRSKAARATQEATPAGTRDDGSAAPAETHHTATFPLRWVSGATTPAFERGDALQANTSGGPTHSGPNGHGAHGARLAGAHHGAERRRASPSLSPGPPLNGARHARQGKSASLTDETPRVKAETSSVTNETPNVKNETPNVKNETRSCHVVVFKNHDSKQEEDLKQQHERALGKNDCQTEGDFDGALHDLAGVLAGCGMRPGDAQRRARRLLEERGADVCARQRQVFERRCELARASPRGLSNPVGLLLASIQEDWSLPAAAAEPKAACWYTDEEFEAFFEH